MSRGIGAELGSSAVAQLLLVALLPSLLFIGHWQVPISIAVPGTPFTIGAGPNSQAAGHNHGDHTGHCHEEAASCSQAPQSAQAPAANLHEIATAIGLTGLALLSLVATWRPWRELGVAPELRPPRSLPAPA